VDDNELALPRNNVLARLREFLLRSLSFTKFVSEVTVALDSQPCLSASGRQ
jgi:hypothetical protein